jgi:hypothetical protein
MAATDGPQPGSIIPDDDPVLVNFDRAGSFVRHHLPKDLCDNALIDKARQVIDLSHLEGVNKIPGFIDQSDLDIAGQRAPERCSVQV